jgi:hypothetical protein
VNCHSTRSDKLDRLPPSSIEAEQGVLGCILLSPDCLAEATAALIGGVDCFYDLRHQIVWRAIVELQKTGKAIDLILLQQHLKDGKKLTDAGGLPYLASLPDAVPSAVGLSGYLEAVMEKWRLRRLLATCATISSRIYEHAGEIETLFPECKRDLDYALSSGAPRTVESKSVRELLAFDATQDDNTVIGLHNGRTTRYICRGQAGWIVGGSGVGKSSLALQEAICFALGLPSFGRTPTGPQRILYVQAENDDGDNAEMMQGILASMSISEFSGEKSLSTLDSNLKIITERELTGPRFVTWLEREIGIHEATMVYVDPFLAFAGVDITKTADTTEFLRAILNPMLAKTGCVFIGCHHKGKPNTGKSAQKIMSFYDLMYEGIGSSELVNWARFVSVMQDLDYPNFKLTLAKRGVRAWATHPSGEPTKEIYLQHAGGDEGIFWKQVDPPKEEEKQPREKAKGGAPSKKQRILDLDLAVVLDTLTQPLSQNQIAKKIEDYAKTKRILASKRTFITVVQTLFENGRLNEKDKGFVKSDLKS